MSVSPAGSGPRVAPSMRSAANATARITPVWNLRHRGAARDDRPMLSRRCQFQLAGRLWTIDAERVEFAKLMEEPFLRRYGNDCTGAGQQNRLAHLAIPIAKGQLLALESCHTELGPPDVGVDAGIVELVYAGRHFGNAANGEPRRIVPLGHRPPRRLREAALHLHGPPLLETGVPAHRH